MAGKCRVVDYLMEYIYEHGAETVFFVPGTGCMHLTDALARCTKMEKVSTHHEQAAAMAALTYAQYRQTIGACVVTTGCGGTNTMTGLLHAWQDSIPCVFISGQAQRSHTVRNSGLPLRQMGRQEADIIALVEPITKYAVMLNDGSEAVSQIEKAVYMATEGRPGPVWIDVPLDIQNTLIDPDEARHFIPPEEVLLTARESEISAVEDILQGAERPVILAGNGIRLGNAIEELNCFAEKFSIPVTYSRLGADLMETANHLSIGMVGMLGTSRAGNFAVANADVILCLGCRLSVDTTGYEFDKFAREAKLVVVDIDEIEHSKDTVKIDMFIHSDVKAFLQKMIQRNINSYTEWSEKCLHWKQMFPVHVRDQKEYEKIDMYYFTEELSKVLPDRAVVLSDAGNSFFTVSPVLKLKNGQRSITSGGQAEMGYALPGAIGAYCASRETVVAINGDGSVMMNLQELETIAFNQIPVKICIMNNNGYSSIRHLQQNAFRGRLIGTDSSCGIGFPDFERIVKAFGIQYVRLENPEKLAEELKEVMQMEGPVVCEVICEEEQEFLTVGTAFNKKKRLVNRPIEDLVPFLDRDVFLSEMIIEPIDQ